MNAILIWMLSATLCYFQPGFVIKELPMDGPKIKISGYVGFCTLDNTNPESAAVKYAIWGDHYKSLHYATINEEAKVDFNNGSFIKVADSLPMAQLIDALLKDPDKQFLAELLLGDHTPEGVFKNAQAIDAIEYILDQVLNHNFILLNEAHYSSQHREFATSLLGELYNHYGFRYLAIEALSLNDSLLEKRGFANIHTGYYTQDPSLGNMVNEALRIGYKLIPYESSRYSHGSLRDLDQAHNIIKQTKAQDPSSKVLIYAGYSHINECCLDDPYTPLGAHLKKIIGEEILTIDQVEMSGLLAREKENQYYRYIFNTSGNHISSASIFLNQKGVPILTPLGKNHIDLQVYHPRTQFVNGRPSWLVRNRNFYPVPVNLKKWKGNLLSIVNFHHPEDAVPVDQFIIDDEKFILLSPGRYRARIFNCAGEIIAKYKIDVD